MVAGTAPPKGKWWTEYVSGGLAACHAEIWSIPADTIKVRLQIQGAQNQQQLPGGGPPKYRGFVHCGATIIREEGPTALWKGISPGLLRQIVFGSLRIGMYPTIRDFYIDHLGDEKRTATLGLRVLAGLTSGGLAISIASPTDLLKVRMQADGRRPPGVPPRYTGLFNAFATIYRQEGITGFWKGVGPNIVRNAVINAAELATYDQVKTFVLKSGFKDDIPTHLGCSLTAGFVATVCGSPVDVVKTRVMNQKVQADGSRYYRSMPHAFVRMMREEGPFGFYKGFWPNFIRIGSWNVIMFMSKEQIVKRIV